MFTKTSCRRWSSRKVVILSQLEADVDGAQSEDLRGLDRDGVALYQPHVEGPGAEGVKIAGAPAGGVEHRLVDLLPVDVEPDNIPSTKENLVCRKRRDNLSYSFAEKISCIYL